MVDLTEWRVLTGVFRCLTVLFLWLIWGFDGVTVKLTRRSDSYRSLMLRVDWGYSCLVGLELTLTVTECLELTGTYGGLV